MAGVHYPKHMAESNMTGLVRFIFAIIASFVLLPIVLRLYLNVAPDATSKDIWNAFIQTAPFADFLGTKMVSVWGEAQSGLESALKGLLDNQGNFTLHFSMELGQLAFSGAVLVLLSSVLGKLLPINVEGGIFSNAANAIFQLLLSFTASLVVDFVFKLFQANLADIMDASQYWLVTLYIFLLFGGGAAILLCLGIVFYFAIVLMAIGCMKLCVSYCIFLWLLLAQMQGGSPIMLVGGVLAWLAAIWWLQKMEKIFVP